MTSPPEDVTIPQVSAKKIADRFANGEIVLLDVREPFEHDMAHVEGSLDIPMSAILERIEELPRDKEIACLCHSGMRSHAVAEFLVRHGFDAVNVVGGIDAWAIEVDTDVPRY